MQKYKSTLKSNKNFNFLLVLLTFTFCLFTYTVNSAHAQTKQQQQILSVSPIIINVPLSPGKTMTKTITIQNLTESPLPLRANLNDFQTTGEEGGYVFTESKTNPLLSWIRISDSEFILNPKATKEITLTITTPKDIPLGGYYGMLFFEPVPQNDTEAITHVVPKIGVLLLASIGVPDPHAKKANIETFTIDPIQSETTLPLLLRVKNVSLHFFTAKPILTLTPLFTFTKQETEPIYLEEKLVFQDKIRRWEQSPDLKKYQPNIYRAHLVVATGDGQDITTDRYFVLFPFVKMVFLIGVLCVLAILIIQRKKVIKAVKILLFNN